MRLTICETRGNSHVSSAGHGLSREALRGQSIKRLVERGLCLSRLRFQYTYTGLYGRTILVFEGESLSRVQTFGPGSFAPSESRLSYRLPSPLGDIAAIYQQGQSIDEQTSLARGLIFRLTTNTIHITTEENDDEQFSSLGDSCQFMIVKMANDVTYRRLKQYVRCTRYERRSGDVVHRSDYSSRGQLSLSGTVLLC